MKLKIVLASLLLVVAVGCKSPVTQLGSVSLSGAMPGQKGRVRVTLANPADGDQKVALTWTGASLDNPPTSVTVPSGKTSSDVAYTAGSALGDVAVTAKLGEDSAQATGSVVSAFSVQYFEINYGGYYDNAEVGVGQTSNVEVLLNAAPPTDTKVTMAASPAGIVTLPDNIVVPAMQQMATFSVTGVALGSANITGKVGDAPYQAYISCYQNRDSFSMNNSAQPNSQLELEFYLAVPSSSDTAVQLTTSNAGVVNPPATLTIPAGQTNLYVYVPTVGSGFATVTATFNGHSYTGVARVSTESEYYYYSYSYPSSTMEVGVSGYVYGEEYGGVPSADNTLSVTASSVGVLEFAASTPWPKGQQELIVPFTTKNPGTTTLTMSANGAGSSTLNPITVVTQAVPTGLGLSSTQKVGVGVLMDTYLSAAVAKDTPITFTQSGTGHFNITGSAVAGTGETSGRVNVVPDVAGTVTLTATANGQTYSNTYTINP